MQARHAEKMRYACHSEGLIAVVIYIPINSQHKRLSHTGVFAKQRIHFFRNLKSQRICPRQYAHGSACQLISARIRSERRALRRTIKPIVKPERITRTVWQRYACIGSYYVV